jgi:hypothetical protein
VRPLSMPFAMCRSVKLKSDSPASRAPETRGEAIIMPPRLLAGGHSFGGVGQDDRRACPASSLIAITGLDNTRGPPDAIEEVPRESAWRG